MSQGENILNEEQNITWILGQGTISKMSFQFSNLVFLLDSLEQIMVYSALFWFLDSGYVSEILNDCIGDMHVGDVCLVTLHLCNELQDHLDTFHTKENSAVDYRIELVSFEKVHSSIFSVACVTYNTNNVCIK